MGDLKEEIKRKMSLVGPASDLDLWKVSNPLQVQVRAAANDSIPVGENLNEDLINNMLGNTKPLSSVDKLSVIFSDPLKE